MKSAATPAVFPSPVRRPEFTPGAHCRALTVNLMELLDTWAGDGREGWEAVVEGRTAAYEAFSPERLWGGGDCASDGGAIDTALHNVVVVFAYGPLSVGAEFSEAEKASMFSGSVLRFLVLRTDFMRHFETYNTSLMHQSPYQCKKDGVEVALLFTDVKVGAVDDSDDYGERSFSVVYLQLVKDEEGIVDRAAVERSATGVINAAHALFFDGLKVTFWVDFTGVLESNGCGSLLLREVRDVWSSIAVASALASAASAPTVKVFVDTAAISLLQRDAVVVSMTAEGGGDTGSNISGIDSSACVSFAGRPCIAQREEMGLGETASLMSLAQLAFEVEEGANCDETDDKSDFSCRRYACKLEQRPETFLRDAREGLSCLFLDCSSDSLFALPGCDASMRDLLVSWSSLGTNHLSRIVVMVADSFSSFENALLSWVRVPWSENALILPLFGVSDITAIQDYRSCLESLQSSSPHLGATAASMASNDATARERLFRILLFAVQHFGIDVRYSACLAGTMSFQQAACLLKLRVVGDYACVSSWVAQCNAEAAVPRDLLDVEREREDVFAKLCATNMLARLLRDRPRRPEVLFRVVDCMRLGIVRPVLCDASAFASTLLSGSAGMRHSNEAVLSLSQQERICIYRYMCSFFTKDVFSISVDIVRSCGTDYFSGYRFLTVGYLRYELSSWVRRHLLVDAHLDLKPLLKESYTGAEGDAEPHWSRVFRRLSCTCTPRRHERLLLTETGVKKCRHLAQLLYWFLQPSLAASTECFGKSVPYVIAHEMRSPRDVVSSSLAVFGGGGGGGGLTP